MAAPYKNVVLSRWRTTWLFRGAYHADTALEAAEEADALAQEYLSIGDYGVVLTLCRGTTLWVPDLTVTAYWPGCGKPLMYAWTGWGDYRHPLTGILGQPRPLRNTAIRR